MSSVAQIGSLTAETVERMLFAARHRAEELALRVNIAVVDGAGNLAGFIRIPGSFLSSTDLAIDKAYTSASFSMSSRGFGELLEQAPRAVREGLLRRPRLTEVPGGLPVMLEGQLVGAVGVSGGTEEEDEEIALVAANEAASEGLSGRE
jgi:uncharacterized protein GlcG (DUF336 family)